MCHIFIYLHSPLSCLLICSYRSCHVGSSTARRQRLPQVGGRRSFREATFRSHFSEVIAREFALLRLPQCHLLKGMQRSEWKLEGPPEKRLLVPSPSPWFLPFIPYSKFFSVTEKGLKFGSRTGFAENLRIYCTLCNSNKQ